MKMKKSNIIYLFTLIALTEIVILSSLSINSRAFETETRPKPSANAEYHVSNYLVILRIDETDIYAKINITYDVTSGTKSSGFKRFETPDFSNAEIDKNSVSVYNDEGDRLSSDFREFDGRDGHHYTEIKFYHSRFSGRKTFTLYFKMVNWMVEYLEGTHTSPLIACLF